MLTNPGLLLQKTKKIIMKKAAVIKQEEKKAKKERSALKEEVYASEVHYRRLFESSKDGILILDAETGKIVDVNPFLIDLLGYSKNELIKKSIWEIGAFQDIIENKDKFQELQQSEYVRYEDFPLETSDGSKIHVEFVSNVYLVNDSKVIQCQIRDITARKKTETTLEKTRKELAEIKKSADELNEFTENVIDTLREPLLAIDQDLRVIKASRSFYQFFKVTAGETIGKLIYELGNHQWDIPKLRELLEKIIPEKNSFDNYEVEHNFSTIGKRVMLLNARQVKRAFGKEQVILLVIEDITERKGKEDSLKETQRETSGSLNILLDLMHAPIIIWDTSMIIKRFNHKFELLSGYDSDEVIGRKLNFLFPKERIAATLELLKNHLEAEHIEVAEIDILTKDNHIKTVLWDSSHILDEDGKNIIATISQDITNRRQSELALRKSESHLRTLVNTIPDLIWLKDTNGVFLSCNPMFERFFGASEPDIIGKTDYDFVDRKLADFFRDNDQKALEAGKPTSNEEWVTFADDGHRAFLDTIKSPIYDSDGTVLGILGIGRDITERMLAGEKLQASEKRFRAIFDQAPVAIALLDTQGHPIISNLRLTKMIGYSSDELAKMMFTEFTYPEDIDKDLNQFTDLIAGKISGYNIEKRYIHKNGTLIWANLYTTTLNDSNGLIQEIIGMVEDITEKKKIHNEIKFQADLINNVGQAVIATDLLGKVTYWNNAAEKIYGWSSSEAIGQNIVDLTPARQSNEQAIDILKKLSAGKTWAGEFYVRRKDGSSFPALVTDTPILDSNGELTGIIGISSDITERKHAEMELIEAKEKAEESDRLKTAFLNNVSHEIRTPMNAIVGFSGFLNDPDLKPNKRQEFTDIIIKSSEHLLAIIDDIIRIASIESGQEKIQKNEININLICDLIKDQFSSKANEKNVTLSLIPGLTGDEADIITDATKLTQILTNLIGNALKFTHQGYINYGYKLKNSQLEFYVEDSGIGIPLDMQEKVFDRFRQIETTATRNFGGSGLGLSISKAYVEILGGKMWLTSEMGKGSVFYFTIPYKKTNPKKLPDIPSVKGLDFEFKTTKTVLIAEDEISNFILLEEMLLDSGINIIRAVNGLEAVRLCQLNPNIDLVLMDIKMPEMDGYEATKRIKEFKPDLPIIAQTAYITEADRVKALACGCSDYISKPISKRLLLSKINEQLHN
ncbi:MAG: hypothetical protein CO098_10020 [Bacteroidetes bacterium CG_4_9_14_3_um_filter_41_19]|nr:MAG: hypothetical protein CO098_10020 [Bacteroidetes bacterium CG_4_9_14_3_um_filter_41_19]